MGKPNGNTHQRKDRDDFEVHPVTVLLTVQSPSNAVGGIIIMRTSHT
jgi:hypothetical protein